MVAAPSKLQRPAGDRVKTDAKDALLLARLLRLGEIVPVAVPTVGQEAARDLVRAREDVRGDLMRARHRTSKLLLRQGIVYAGGTAWTGAHLEWLRRQSFDQRPLGVAYDSALESVLLTADRRDRLDKAILELAADPAWSEVVGRLSCLRGVSTLTAFGLAVEVGDWSRFTGSSIGAFLGLVRPSTPAAPVAARVRSPRPGTHTPAGCWSKPPGITSGPTGRRRRRCGAGGSRPRQRPGGNAAAWVDSGWVVIMPQRLRPGR